VKELPLSIEQEAVWVVVSHWTFCSCRKPSHDYSVVYSIVRLSCQGFFDNKMDEIVKQVKIYFCCLKVRVCVLFIDANVFEDCWFTVSSGTVIGDGLESV